MLGHLLLPGVSGAYASTPDHSSLRITGDIDIRVLVAMDDWTPSGVQRYLSRYTGGGAPPANRSYTFGNTGAGGQLRWSWSDGTTERTVNSSVAPSVSNGQRLGVRVTMDVDNGSGGHAIRFFTSVDYVTWLQLGATQNAGAFTTSIVAGTAPLEIGARGGGTIEMLAGKLYAYEVRNEIDGEVRSSADFRTLGSGTRQFIENTGKLITVNGSASIVGHQTEALGTLNPAGPSLIGAIS